MPLILLLDSLDHGDNIFDPAFVAEFAVELRAVGLEYLAASWLAVPVVDGAMYPAAYLLRKTMDALLGLDPAVLHGGAR